MQYKYAQERPDYSDFASGRVFYSLPGHPAFPIRLASEIFQRCLENRKAIYNVSAPCTLYDPCCGTAYHLSVLAYFHPEHIREIVGSDIDEKAVTLAAQNLGLLSVAGMEKRIRELSRMLEQYGKDAHKDALSSAQALKEKLDTPAEKYPVATKVFQASATDRQTISRHLQPGSVDLVFTDVPYGQHSQWQDSDLHGFSNPIESMLDALLDRLSPTGIVAVVSDKGQKVLHTGYQRVEKFQIGKRRAVILRRA